MNILIANYRYFISGGPERYMFNVMNELARLNHEVIPFSVHYNENIESQYDHYFVEPIGSRDDVFFTQHKNSMNAKVFLRTLSRLFYSKEVEKAVIRVAEDTKPQIAYILHYLRKLSPSLLVGLKKKGIPIIVRLSDYGMVCPQAHFLRNEKPCTLCLQGSIISSIRHRCVQESLIASSLNAAAAWTHKFKKYFDLIDCFVTTNPFMTNMMIEAGFPETKIVCIPTFTDINTFKPANDSQKSNYFIYAGRLTQEKGVHILLEALNILKQKNRLKNINCKIIGNGPDNYVQQLKEKVDLYDLDKNIDFFGYLSTDQMTVHLNHALFSVVPSIWFENLPNSIIESYACGTPVIASDEGSLSFCVKDGSTGCLFQTGRPEELAEKIEYCLDNPALLQKMSKNCRSEALETYSPDSHCNSLISLFEKYI